LPAGPPPSDRRGVGLANTRERLKVLYGENCRFAAINCHPGLRVDMALPLETAATLAAGEPARLAAAARVSGKVPA
jgi:LytS/YehU family sensor histidine kinase